MKHSRWLGRTLLLFSVPVLSAAAQAVRSLDVTSTETGYVYLLGGVPDFAPTGDIVAKFQVMPVTQGSAPDLAAYGLDDYRMVAFNHVAYRPDGSLFVPEDSTRFLLFASNGDSLYGTWTIDFVFEEGAPPGSLPYAFNAVFTFRGGTGRFAGASGSLAHTGIYTGPPIVWGDPAYTGPDYHASVKGRIVLRPLAREDPTLPVKGSYASSLIDSTSNPPWMSITSAGQTTHFGRSSLDQRHFTWPAAYVPALDAVVTPYTSGSLAVGRSNRTLTGAYDGFAVLGPDGGPAALFTVETFAGGTDAYTDAAGMGLSRGWRSEEGRILQTMEGSIRRSLIGDATAIEGTLHP